MHIYEIKSNKRKWFCILKISYMREIQMDNCVSDYSTEELYDFVSRSESIEDYKKILTNIAIQSENWKKVIKDILRKNEYSITKFAELCGVSRQSVQKWLNGTIPKSRDMFIRIGFAAGFDLDEMNHFLQRYAYSNKLYSKNLGDLACIYILSSDKIEHNYNSYQTLINMIKDELEKSEVDNLGKNDSYETLNMSVKIKSLDELSQMLQFVRETAPVYKKQYYKLYDYINEYINKNLINDYSEEDNVKLLAESQEWSASLKKCVSEISQKKWYPQREKIISLGIHLNMNINQINTMLELAQMESLCAKIPFENAVIYALENAELENIIVCDGTNELSLYVRKILESLNIEYINFFLDELPREIE